MSDQPDSPGIKAVAVTVKQSFSPEQKVRTASQYQAVLRRNRPIVGSLLEIYCFDAKADHPRMGVIVGKRALKRAVDRNYVKRVVRESFRLCATRLSPRDFVIRLRATKSLDRASLASIRREVDGLLSRFVAPVSPVRGAD